jgi:hypothetical protein
MVSAAHAPGAINLLISSDMPLDYPALGFASRDQGTDGAYQRLERTYGSRYFTSLWPHLHYNLRD